MTPDKLELDDLQAASTFRSLAESSVDVLVLAALDGTIAYLNPTARRLLDVAGMYGPVPDRLEDVFATDDLAYVREVIVGTLAREGRWTGDYRLRSSASPAGLAANLSAFYVYEGGAGEPIAMALTARAAEGRRQAEQRLRALIEAGPALAHSLDYAQTLTNLAELVVRSLATFCVVDVFATPGSPERRIRRVAGAHLERARQHEVDALATLARNMHETEHPVVRVLADGTSSLVERIDDAWLARSTTSPEHAAALRRLGIRSMVSVPLVASGRALGALTCYIATEGRVRAALPDAYDPEDLFFLEELGRRAGIAIDNALSFAHERSIASALQAASLPQTLPSGPSLRIFADYRPGSAEARIGGDWYDALALENGDFVFTIGDVVGHGLRAGIVMTKLRQAMQAAAMVDPDPNVMLAVADRTLRLHDDDGYATSLAARYDPQTRALTFASAGHPGPLLRHADGSIDDLTQAGILLGMRNGRASETNSVAIPRGTLLVFFTDGLVEATRDMAEGQRRLSDAVRDERTSAATNPAEAIVTQVLRGEPAGDDIAVLVVAFD